MINRNSRGAFLKPKLLMESMKLNQSEFTIKGSVKLKSLSREGYDIFWDNKVMSHNSLKYMSFHRGGDSTATQSQLEIFIP